MYFIVYSRRFDSETREVRYHYIYTLINAGERYATMTATLLLADWCAYRQHYMIKDILAYIPIF